MARKKPEAIEFIEKVIYDILDKSLENQITVNAYTARSLKDSHIVRETVKVKRSINKNEKFTMVIISSFSPNELKMPLACKLVLDIEQNLKMNNPLWYCAEFKKSQYRKALDELEELQVLKRLRGSGMCFIFPNKIRRGYLIDIIGALEHYLNKQRKKLSQANRNDIIDLEDPPIDYYLSGYHVRSLCS